VTVASRRPHHLFSAAAHSFAEPAATVPESERRRSRLLAWLLLTMILLMALALVVVLIADESDRARRSLYLQVIPALMIPVLVAWGLNRKGRYRAAAWLTVAAAVAAPWVSLIMDPVVLRGDLVPLAYVTLGILLSSVLLPARVTVVLAIVQGVALSLVALLAPSGEALNWPSLLSFLFFTALLAIISNVISQRDMRQIDLQAAELAIIAERLRNESIRDHLTGLFNRRYMDEALEREIDRALRNQAPLGLIVLDIDYFKDVNDRKGHLVGDMVLQEIGTLLSENVRRFDVACRCGGDEFVLILPDAPVSATEERAERLRQEIGDLRVALADEVTVTPTVSIGVAVYPDHGSSGEEVFVSADAALYAAKSQGRDRVVSARAPVAT
jgi:diguanylate cyclase (GGDEF)-like protein